MTNSPRPVAQPVTSPITNYAIFIVVKVNPGKDNPGLIRSFCPDISALVRSVGFRVPGGQLSCIVGFGSDVWDSIFGSPRPAELRRFQAVGPSERLAVSTPGDVLFHIRGQRMDLCFELVGQIMARLGDAVVVVDEVQGFRYFDNRDLIGFVDGTENPSGQAAIDFTVVGEEDPAFAAGSYVIIQKYIHDMAGWNAVPMEEQERIIGRTKLSDIELSDSVKPSYAHNVLTTLMVDGKQVKIFRDNMPFGQPGKGEFGTYFIGYSRSPATTEEMIKNMFVGKPPGNYDKILDFSRAVTGNLFFVPSQTFLDGLAGGAP